jgi:hypothetical protein
VTALRAEAVLTWLYAAGFGIAAPIVAVYVRRHGRLPRFFDLFDMFGGPWWERVRHGTFERLLVAFFSVAALASWAAWLVWDLQLAGAILTLAVLPVEAIFWFGFDLPIPKVFGAARLVLLVVGWSALR